MEQLNGLRCRFTAKWLNCGACLFSMADMAKKKKVSPKPAIPKNMAGINPTTPAAAVAPQAPPAPKPNFASIYPGLPTQPGQIDELRLPSKLAECVRNLESELALPVWLLIQDAQLEDREEYAKDSVHMIGDVLASAFFAARHSSLSKGQKIALFIDSNGGLARSAYELAMLLRRHCGGFTAVIPRHAKSAATLLTLGADQIIMNDHAELGPLDVQVWDPDREELLSGLDEVKALEQLHAFAMQAFDKTMLQILRRTGKKVKSVLPVVAQFVTRLAEPMFDKVDVVRFNQMSRALKINTVEIGASHSLCLSWGLSSNNPRQQGGCDREHTRNVLVA